MGKMVEFFLDRPLLVNLIIIVVIGLGIKSAYESQKEGFPEISLNKIIIQTIYPGASANDVELNVTVAIEDALNEVDGIKEVLSVSEEGISRVEVQADENATSDEFRKLYSDVDNALSKIDNLPDDIDGKPSMAEFTSKDIPVMEIAYTGPYKKLKPYIDYIETKIKKISGVASVHVTGLPDEEVQILVDPVLAKRQQVGLKMISNAIKKRNLEGSGGTLESFIGEKKIVSLNKFENYKDVLNTNITMSADGYGVKLKQVATLQLVPEDLKLIVRNNGKRGAALSVKKIGSSDLIKTVDGIKELFAKETLPEGVGMKVLRDQSNFTRNRINLLVGNALIGIILVTSILFLIFDIKTAFWTAFGIPFSLMGMLMFIKAYGVSLNIISLGGFIIIIGMLVDDAIVISEAISSNKEKGMEPKTAAIEAVKKMWMPVTTACLTTMIAFSPLFFIGGFPGKFIWAIPLMVVVGLLVSLFESFFILPAHLYHGKTHHTEKKAFVVKIENVYKKIIEKALKHKYPVLLLFVFILLLSIVSINKFVAKDPFPQDASEGFKIKITLPKGINEERAEMEVKNFEKVLLGLPEDELVGISARIGTHSEFSNTDRGTQNNIAIIFVYLKPFSNRSRTAEQIIKDLENDFNKIIVNKKIEYSSILTRLGPPLGRPFEIRILSNDNKLRYSTEQKIREYLSTIKGIYDVDNDETDGKDELNILMNHDILSRTGLTVSDVLTTLRIAFDGQIVTELTTVDKTTNFRLRLNKKGRADINFINDLPIMNSSGNIINLKRLVKLVEQPSKAEINHVDWKRSLTLSGNTDLNIISPIQIMQKVKNKFPSNEKVEIVFSGQPVETKNIFAGLSSSAVTAFVGIFLLISLIFNSFKKPIIIILTLPFLLIGITFTLLTHGMPMSMFVGIAIIGLMGVVVNDSIVMVHTIDDMAENKKITSGIIVDGAVSRIRPILLTTITTIFGILPTGYGIGGYDPFLSQMSLALAYGLLFSTFVILFIVPIFYNIGIDIGNLFNKSTEK